MSSGRSDIFGALRTLASRSRILVRDVSHSLQALFEINLQGVVSGMTFTGKKPGHCVKRGHEVGRLASLRHGQSPLIHKWASLTRYTEHEPSRRQVTTSKTQIELIHENPLPDQVTQGHFRRHHTVLPGEGISEAVVLVAT